MSNLVWTLINNVGRWAAPSGGGGSSSVALHGPFPFAFDTAGLNDGVSVYTPTPGDWLLDAWVELTTEFDGGTSPLFDFGDFTTGDQGVFAYQNGATLLDGTYPTDRLISGNKLETGGIGLGAQWLTAFASSPPFFRWQLKFTTADPIKVVVSQNGQKGGAASGATSGAANFYLLTATPST